MNAFKITTEVSRRSLEILRPYLEIKSDGRLVLTDKGLHSKFMQEVIGDVIINDKKGNMVSIELKAEEENKYGNLFLETWSNRNLNNIHNYAEYPPNVGWIYKTQANYIIYHFLSSGEIYTLDTFALKRWAFGYVENGRVYPANIYGYKEKPQSKYVQKNDAWGRCVAIEDLQKALPRKMWKEQSEEYSWRYELAAE